MKTRAKNKFALRVLIAALGLMAAGPVTAQTFETLHDFSAPDQNYSTNGDGANPLAGLVLSGTALYGTAQYGGDLGGGTVFGINTDGSGFTNVYGFPDDFSQGSDPQAALILSGNTLYGTTDGGDVNNSGTVFAVNTNGSDFTTLYGFSDFDNTYLTNGDGGQPEAALVLSGNNLYGTSSVGGDFGAGTIFAVNTDTLGFTNLHSFSTRGTNSDGSNPDANLILSGNTLYGTAFYGGIWGLGTVFAIQTNGSGFTNLHSFVFLKNGEAPEGANPFAGLVLSGNTLYGTTTGGGRYGMGAIFAVNTNGADFTNLYSFTGAPESTNSDGASPQSALVLSGATLYGTATSGGAWGNGTVFAMDTNGSGFTTLYNFTASNPDAIGEATNSDGIAPNGLILSSNTLYGTASKGGTSGYGTVFSLALGPPVIVPRLAVTLSGTNVILTWPTNAAGFTLQSATNLASPVWTPISGQFAVTNGISGAQQFFRLAAP
jgi:uncharacterized repeat protein (TIGR03803 family)